jgi:hypothetical protein
MSQASGCVTGYPKHLGWFAGAVRLDMVSENCSREVLNI